MRDGSKGAFGQWRNCYQSLHTRLPRYCWSTSSQRPETPHRPHTSRRIRALFPATCRRSEYPSRSCWWSSGRQSFPPHSRTGRRSPRGHPCTSGMFRSTMQLFPAGIRISPRWRLCLPRISRKSHSTARFQLDTCSWGVCRPCHRRISGALCRRSLRHPSPVQQDKSN